jgi:DNA primase
MIDKDLLRRIRNDLPMAVTIIALGREGPPSKHREGRFVFLCPRCGEMLVAVNPRNNLAHCFSCHKNWNNIDLLLTLGYTFHEAVTVLDRFLKEFLSQRPPRANTAPQS